MSCNYDAAPNTILRELDKIKDAEMYEGIRTPIPNYLYIPRYGRKLRGQMDEILARMGKKGWFFFKADEWSEGGKLVEKFNMDLQKHSDTGKEYTGCVLIELSKETLMKDGLPEFFEYLKEKEQQFFFLFAVKDAKDAAAVQKCMEQYFFTRVVYADEFSIEEQFDIIRNICREYGFGIDLKEQAFIIRGLKEREWKENEHMEFILQNAAKAVIYETMLDDKAKERSVSAEMSEKLLENLQKTAKKEKVFGFCAREEVKREEYQYE